MKTIMLDNKILRVNDKEALKKIEEGWKYIPKSVWKEKVRSKKKKEVE